ncbi:MULTISPECIES: Trp biosynthesis-associated membrane protein [Arthrobacter]|uniref:Trp biosynthesis-associated membrane protein n=1 Tax=unclassified Arthrobacter TaxID=235627 RepID=UPI0024B9E7A9|nr:Trp biosynthesis-associated membrane protein [Arthrobacter sp. H35-MC1]MDJ0318060.1 Trp biosynthesis-associated membrane protein [Arthrobacter sp. H35-MC1]
MSTELPHTSARTVPFWQRKSTLILLAVLAALAVFGTTTQTWIHVAIGQGEVAQTDLDIPGSKAAVAVSALALVALAGSLATSIAGKIARYITTAIMALSAVGIAAVVLGVLTNPVAAAMAEVGAATGIEGQGANATTTIFPVLAMVAAVILGIAALLVLWYGRSWSVRTKYDAAKETQANTDDEPIDEIDRWDQLSRGEDPTV